MPRPTRRRERREPGAGLMSLRYMGPSLGFDADEIRDSRDHPAHGRRVLELDRLVQPAEAEAAHGLPVPGAARDRALDQCHLDLLLLSHRQSQSVMSATFLPRLAAISAGVRILRRPSSVARTTL